MFPSLFIKPANALCRGCMQTVYFSVYSSAPILQAAVEQKGKKAGRSIALVQLSIQQVKSGHGK